LIRSEEFDDSEWQKTIAGTGILPTINANFAIAPDGNQTADRAFFDRQSGVDVGDVSVIANKSFTNGTAGKTYTATVYIKSATSSNQNVLVYINRGGQNEIAVVNVTQEYTRVQLSLTISTNGRVDFQIGTRGGSFGGDFSVDVILWGAQLEEGAYATSYIPTVASTVTRNADVISKTGVSDLIGQTEGTIYAEIKVNKLIGTAARYIFHLSDGTVNNRIYMAFSGSSSNVLRARIFNGGALQCSIDTSALTNTGTYKLALAYKNNDIVFYVNGVQIGVDTSATIPTCSRVDLGQNYAGASLLGDGINNANIWKERLTNTELATLTTL
jgi:hypothetical protein